MDLKDIHKKCYNNKDSVNKSNLCGCFYCLKVFPATEVKVYHESKRKEAWLCPYCEVDSVLGDNDVEITSDLLKRMHEEYFEKIAYTSFPEEQ